MPELRRRGLLQSLAVLPLLGVAGSGHALSLFRGPTPARWPLWAHFADGFVQNDGRVIDWTDGGRTVSEGQAYALFFALIADDREGFARLLRWTEANLADGDLGSRLPAWLWGQDLDSDRWGVLDSNPASDADLFIAYALMEAGRLWRKPDYEDRAQALLALIRERETLQRHGRHLLLPAPDGFVEEAVVRLNPSYIVPFQMRYFAVRDPDGPWAAILRDFVAASPGFLPNGLPPDWMLLDADGYRPDEETGTLGSFDAIRCFLWSVMRVPGLDVAASYRKRLHRAAPMIARRGVMPERWDVASGALHGEGPPGFQLCAAAWLADSGRESAAGSFGERAEKLRRRGLYGEPARYYDQVLALFARGWMEQRFRFAADGSLIPEWNSQ